MNFSVLPIPKVLAHFKVKEDGLSNQEVAMRRQLYGANELPLAPGESLWRVILSPFANLFVLFLLVAIFISLLTNHPFDALVIGLIVMIDAIIEWSQHYSANRVLQVLNKSTKPTALVRRNGKVAPVSISDLVPGDIVILNEGDTVPADGRLINLQNLQSNESALTGESLPIEKETKHISDEVPIYSQTNMVFRGTSIVGGRGECVITVTGGNTEFARIANLTTDLNQKAPIQIKIDALVKYIAVGVIVLGAVTFGLGLLRNYPASEMLRFVLALSVSAIPEGLPIALTLILLLSIKTMARYKAVVKKLPTVETLGMVTTIATDKTGTLTENELALAETYSHTTKEHLERTISLSISRNDLSLNPLNNALRSITNTIPEGYKEVFDMPFKQSLRLSAVVWQHGKLHQLNVIGAPEAIIDRSTDKNKAKLSKQANTLSEAGYKVIGLAEKPLANWKGKINDHDLDGLNFVGLIALEDKTRPEAKEAVALAQEAGIKVLMLTGDHLLTTTTVAKRVGIITSGEQVSSGELLEQMPEQQVPKFLSKLRALSRVLPEHKFKILKALKKNDITAMTGDGVNDAPALVEADVGIAMGSGTEVAKEAADMVLLDDNFLTIMHAVRIGRVAFTNIRKMVFYLLATNLGEILTMIGSLIIGLPLPITATQILWVNLVTDGAAVIPLGLEPAEPNVMKQPPIDPSKQLLDGTILARLLLVSVIMAGSTLYIFATYLPAGFALAQTMAFTNLVVIQWANALNARSETASALEGLRRPNLLLIGGLGAGIALQALIMLTPLGNGFGLAALRTSDLIMLLWPALAVVVAVELHKLWIKRSAQKAHSFT